MRILTRYILREIVQHAAIGAAVFTFVIFMRDVGRILELAVRNSAPLPSVAEIFFLTLPAALAYTVPTGVLVGILIGLSRLAADSEVTVMRASGFGVGMFVRVVSLFAVTAFILASFNSLWLAPRSAAALLRLQNSLRKSQAAFEIQPRVFYEDFKNYVLYVQDVRTTTGKAVWKNLFVADISSSSSPTVTLAHQATVVGETSNGLTLHLQNGARHETVPRSPDQYTISTFVDDETQFPIQGPKEESPKAGVIGPVAELSTPELWRQARQPSQEIARWYGIEFHRRLALPFACLVLALVGIPLGVAARQGGKSTGFVLSIVLVFLYYFVSLFGLALARQGKVSPALGIWMANLIFGIFGLMLLWRVDRIPRTLGLEGVLKDFKNWLKDQIDHSVGKPLNLRTNFASHFPHLLDDLILREFGTYFMLILASFLVLSLIFTFFELLRDIIRNHIDIGTITQYLVNVLPSMVYLMTPLCVLLAVLITFGLLQKTNQLVAIKSSGISIYRTVAPLLLVGCLLSAGLFLFEQYYLPGANKRQETLRNTIKGRPAQTYLRPDRRWIVGLDSTVYYYEFFDPDRNLFGNISVFQVDPHSFQMIRRIHAARAQWNEGLQKWVFEQGWTRIFRGEAIEDYKTFDVATFEDMKEPPSYFKKDVVQSSEMNYKELGRYIEDLKQSGYDVVRFRVQLQKKFAFPIITLVMMVLAIPFSLSAGHRGALTGTAVAIGIAISYWVISGLFEAMGNVSQLPPAVAAWTPDLLFALLGGYMVLKTST